MSYDSTSLNQQFNDLQDNILSLYVKYKDSYDNHPIDLREENEIADYLEQSLGKYFEVNILEIRESNILINDPNLGEDVEIKFSDLEIFGKFRILEIYEDTINTKKL